VEKNTKESLERSVEIRYAACKAKTLLNCDANIRTFYESRKLLRDCFQE